MKINKLRLLEFLLIGLALDMADNLLAINLATDEKITLRILLIAFLVAVPFGILSELVVDHPNFWKRVMNFLKIGIKEIEEKIEKNKFSQKVY